MKHLLILASLFSGIGAAFAGLGYFRTPAPSSGKAQPFVAPVAVPSAHDDTPARQICITTDVRGRCKAGQLAWFAPSRWGNDQLPITFAAAACDFRYPVVWNNGGVACVYTDTRREHPLETATMPDEERRQP